MRRFFWNNSCQVAVIISVPSWSWSATPAFFCPLNQKSDPKRLRFWAWIKRLPPPKNHENDSVVILAEIEAKSAKMRAAGQLATSFSWRVYVFSSVLFCLTTVHSSNWQENIRPKLFAKLNSRDYQSFSGTLKVWICHFTWFQFDLYFIFKKFYE